VDEPAEGEMTVMTAAMMAKYCAIEEMNGRVNPAMSDSDEDSPNGKGGGPLTKSSRPATQPQSEDENEKKPAGVKSVKQYQTKL
jgi:hypothetical protein